ncbi:hypothetical protein ACFX1T_047107 [Malus domestica]
MVESHAMFSIVSALHASNEASAKIADAVQAKNPDTDPGLTELTSSMPDNGLAMSQAQTPNRPRTGACDEDVDRVGMGPLTSPVTIPKDWNLDLDNLGPQLCLLNLITSQEQSDEPGNISTTLITSVDLDIGWIIDSGATDHMAYDRNLFNSTTTPPRDSIVTANEGIAQVTGAGSVALTLTISLHKCALVSTLSSHLLSMGQVTKQLDYVVLMFSSFCLLKDIKTQAIIGRGTKRKGLYYVDDVAQGRVHQVQGRNSGKLKTVQLWHRRLGHASFGYL